MLTDDEKEFEDQIQRMKLKNQRILEKFQASEEDRKLAESNGSVINKNQNVQIRINFQDGPKLRNKRETQSRPKSYHGNMYEDDKIYDSYQKFNENRKHGKYQKSKKDEEAYQDYMHFQQTHFTRNNYSSNIPALNRFNRSSSITDRPDKRANNIFSPYLDERNNNSNVHKGKFNQNGRSDLSSGQKSGRFNATNHTTLNKRFSKENRESVLPKTENDSSKYKSVNTKQLNVNNTNSSNSNAKRKSKSKYKLNNSQNNTESNDNPKYKKVGSNQKRFETDHSNLLDDEYIDDTLEDLEQYRLKVDMEDFIVIDPESPDPILAMPLKPWSKDDSILDYTTSKSDCELTHDVLDSVKERAKNYLSLGHPNIDNAYISSINSDDEKHANAGLKENLNIDKAQIPESTKNTVILKHTEDNATEHLNSKLSQLTTSDNNRVTVDTSATVTNGNVTDDSK